MTEPTNKRIEELKKEDLILKEQSLGYHVRPDSFYPAPVEKKRRKDKKKVAIRHG